MDKINLESCRAFWAPGMKSVRILYSGTCYSKLDSSYNFNIDFDGTLFYNKDKETSPEISICLLGAGGAEKTAELKYHYGKYPLYQKQYEVAARLTAYLFWHDFELMAKRTIVDNPLEYPGFTKDYFCKLFEKIKDGTLPKKTASKTAVFFYLQ